MSALLAPRPLLRALALCIITALVIIGVYVLGNRYDLFAASAVDEMPTELESKNRVALLSQAPGDIIFDSNRSGSFGIYRMRFDGSELRAVIDTPRHEMYPAANPDGTLIAFAVADSTDREAKSEVWVAAPDGSEPRKVADNGSFPRFSRDGATIYFQRARRAIVALSLADGTINPVFPRPGLPWGKYQIVSPRVSPDGRYAAFTSDRGGRWHAWYVDLTSGDMQVIGKGCEPGWFPDSTKIAFIHKATAKERSGVFGTRRGDKKIHVIQDADAPRGHEYFPTITPDGRFLLYSASRPREHDHITANYQIFVLPLGTSAPVRITFDRFNNRWPTLLPVAISSDS